MTLYKQFTESLTSYPSSDSRYQKVVESIGATGLYLCAFFSLLGIAGSNVGLGLMLLAFLLSPAGWKRLWREPVFWICLLLIIYITTWVFWTNHELPDLNKLHNKKGESWAFLCLFFLTGWWISRSPQRIKIVLLLAPIGFLLGIISSLDTQTMNHLLAGGRSGLHFGKPIIFGFHCAIIILGLLIFFPRCLNAYKSKQKTFKLLLVIATIILLAVLLQGLIISKSRGVWLAIALVLPPTLYLFYRHTDTKIFSRKLIWLGGVLFISAFILILGINWKSIQARLGDENQIFMTFFSQDLDSARLSSSSYRLHMWRFGIKKWSEQPLIGWGPGNTQYLVGKETDQGLVHPSGVPWDHLHNAYIELLLQLGLVGTLLAFGAIILLIKGILRGYRQGSLPRDMFLFLMANYAFIAIYSLTDFRHMQWNWRFYWLLIAGISLAYVLTQKNTRQ